MDKAIQLIKLLADRPWTIFIVLSLGYGYAYYDQTNLLLKLEREIGGLHAEMKTMNTVIKLKAELAARECH